MRKPALLLMLSFALIACSGEPGVSPTPVLSIIDVTLGASAIEVGQVIKIRAMPLDQHGDSIVAGTPIFASSDPKIAEVNPTTGEILGISSGSAQIMATVGARTGQRTVNVAFPPMIVINEIKSGGDGTAGWVELYNPTSHDVDLSGWKVANEHVEAVAVLPVGTTIAAKGYLVVDGSMFPLGLSKIGGVHLFSRFNVLVEDQFWSTPMQSTIGRCANGTGDFVALATPTRGAANVCLSSSPR